MATPDPQNPYAPPQARVEDLPEGSGGAELAGRGARLLAVIVDGIISAAIVIPIWIWGFGRPLFEPMGLLDTALYLLFAFGVYLAINGTLLARHGQSIGKRLLGIRIVRNDGSQAGLLRLFGLRYAANTTVMMIPLLGLVYALADSLAIFGQQKKCLHDHIADTRVIKA
jgi:uncharacterized RDD family membrane protein YckC